MYLKFSKYEGLGNDFIIVDEMLPLQTRILLCDRHKGVGADGLITVTAAPAPAIAYMHITNQDGSTAEMCGNGFRCVVLWLMDQGKLGSMRSGVILTDAGEKSFLIQDQLIRVDMGQAKMQPGICADDTDGTVVDMGNPHFVVHKKISID